MTPRPDQVVTVFTPSNAPHLARIADEIVTQVQKFIEALPTETLIRLLQSGDAIAQAREELKRFRRRIGIG